MTIYGRYPLYCSWNHKFPKFMNWRGYKNQDSHWTILTCMYLAFCKWTLGNSVDPDQIQQNVASDQGLHCFLIRISMWNIKKRKSTPDIPKILMDLSN